MNDIKQITRDGISLHVAAQGPADRPAIVFANSLGTDLRLWDEIVALLPKDLRIIRYDMRGHGQSDVPDAPYTMGQLVSDAEAVCDAFKLRDVLFVGLSVGGMVAQGLAIKRPDLVRALVLSNTAAKIGNGKLWQDRITTVQSKGLEAMADEVMKRWFSPGFYASDAMRHWRDMLVATPITGYVGICHAIAGTDFYTTTAALTLPSLVIAGSEDGASPPDLIRETAELIKGSRFELIRRAGHLPCVEQPNVFAALLTEFLSDIGHT